jgi:hypothetical protein
MHIDRCFGCCAEPPRIVVECVAAIAREIFFVDVISELSGNLEKVAVSTSSTEGTILHLLWWRLIFKELPCVGLRERRLSSYPGGSRGNQKAARGSQSGKTWIVSDPTLWNKHQPPYILLALQPQDKKTCVCGVSHFISFFVELELVQQHYITQ